MICRFKVKRLLNKYFNLYPLSVNQTEEGIIAMAKNEKERILVINGFENYGFSGEDVAIKGIKYKVCGLNHENAMALRKALPFTAPSRVLREQRSFGLGDRLGIATHGHIKLFKKYDACPIFAQQSIRELNLTERTYEDVLDCVTFNVLQDGFKKPWGADGDHLKHEDEIRYALSLGFTMLTLDCSEHIKTDVLGMSDEEVLSKASLDEDLKNKYLNLDIKVEDKVITFSEVELARCVLTYSETIEFAKKIYFDYVDGKEVDFELSIDETSTPTLPVEHYFIARELSEAGVKLVTVAPRFCGEFQKGIDYIGDLGQFEAEMKIHVAIANHFGYKLSIHSGSDKFSVFEIIGRITKGHFHVKTAGTNWLEAMKVVAKCDASLYREVHKYALSMFEEAKKYYHVTTNINNIPDVDTLADDKLVELFDNNDCRQLIHITYGFILTNKDSKGNYVFKNRLYDLWDKESEEYANMLVKHIGHHLELLYKGMGK